MEAAEPKAVTASRTNGFLFSDLRNYTKFVEAHGDAAAAALLDRYRRLVRREVAEFSGAEIKTEGDSFYVVFPSASGAVQCGLAIVRAVEVDARESGQAPITVGIGVHAGETVETAEGYVGSAVNIAARVCSQAAAGEVLVTDTVRGLIRTVAQVRFVERGPRKLKGIEEPMVLYRVEPLGEGHEHGTARRRRPADIAKSRPARVGLVLAAAAVVVAGAVGVSALLGGSRAEAGPSALPGASPTLAAIVSTAPSSEPSESAAASQTSTLATADADLLTQVPSDLRPSCASTQAADERHGTVASVRCDLPLAGDADTAWYDRYANHQQLETEIFGIAGEENLPPTTDPSCSAEPKRGQGPWHVGSTFSGTVLCFTKGGSTWIVWSYDAERIVARAVRQGDTPADWRALYEWWSQERLFLH
jgi:class 3 adenylate cyclase